MSILVDTSVLYERENAGAKHHPIAKRAVDTILAGAHGRPLISDYIFDEATTLVLARTGRYTLVKRTIDRLRGRGRFPDTFGFVRVGEDGFERGLEVFETYPDQGLSFTDATSIAVMEQHGIDRILSFDDDFDGIVDRVDPREV